MKKNIDIPAVHDNDLRKILDKFNVSTKIDNGEIYCDNCDETITWDNLHAFKVINGSLLLYCSNNDCIESSIK